MKNISIKRYIMSTSALILMVILGISCSNKEGSYTLSPEKLLSEITSEDNYLDAAALAKMDNAVFIDLRSPLDFEFSHHEFAINIPAEKIMTAENQKVIKEIIEQGKTIVLYGDTPRQAAGYWTQLKQIGIENIKAFNGTFNQLMNDTTASMTLLNEVPQIDTSLIKKAGNDAGVSDAKPVNAPKITPRKTAKPTASGGC